MDGVDMADAIHSEPNRPKTGRTLSVRPFGNGRNTLWRQAMSMDTVRSISAFLRHVRERDLPDSELFELKARTFDEMADQYDEDGQVDDAAECRRIAAESRATAVSGAAMDELGGVLTGPSHPFQLPPNPTEGAAHMPPPRVPERKLERWTQRWDTIENLAAAVNDAVPTILTASAHPATDPYPDKTLGEGNSHAGGPSDPTGRHAEQHAGGTSDETTGEWTADTWQEQRDPIAEHLREIEAVTAEILGHLRRVHRLANVITNRRDPRTHDTGGNCAACTRWVSGAADDRLRALYCEACYRAWTRYRDACNKANELPNHALFERERLQQAEERAARERNRKGAA